MSNSVAKYVPGESFSCVKRPLVIRDGQHAVGDPCGAEIVMHDYHWCPIVCPHCLALYFVGHSAEGHYSVVKLDSGWFQDQQAVRDNIARHGGQYVPEFGR